MASSTPLTEANTTFTLALFKKITEENKSGNVFYSPLSISSALAMVLLGARGNTSTQMSEALQHQKGEEDINASFSKLLSELNKPDALYSLSLANRLYGEKTYQFVQEFLDETRKYYQADLQSVDFQAKAEEARVEINTWVEKQTQAYTSLLVYKNLLTLKKSLLLTPPSQLSYAQFPIQLVLVNAIYFKGKWDKQFKEEATKETAFKLNKILELPYEGRELSMLICLPMEIEDGTTGLEKVGTVQRGMSSANDLVLSKVVHKAFVEVNEEGTEAAAAATFCGNIPMCAVINSFQFVADHPFLFFIRHNPSKSILFAGRYSSPE
ncbi:unnamed protein product [Boreogadus saida]